MIKEVILVDDAIFEDDFSFKEYFLQFKMYFFGFGVFARYVKYANRGVVKLIKVESVKVINLHDVLSLTNLNVLVKFKYFQFLKLGFDQAFGFLF